MITKSGTNSYHGSAYFYDTETALNANDFLSKKAGNPTPQFCRQQFGGGDRWSCSPGQGFPLLRVGTAARAHLKLGRQLD